MKLTKKYRETLQKTVLMYQGNAVGFRADRINLPNKKTAQREYLTHPGAVGILAFPKPDQIILVKQYRYPVKEFTYELPAGKLSVGENPAACVRRELEEETGYRARKIEEMLSYWPTAAFSDEVIHLFLARNLETARAHPDEDEFLELARLTPAEMERMIRKGVIRDSKTIIAFLAWRTLFPSW